MIQCPIIRKEIEEEECKQVIIHAYNESKDKKVPVANKFKRIVGWKAICLHCKNHIKE